MIENKHKGSGIKSKNQIKASLCSSKKYQRGFPGGAVVKNPPANGGHGFEPWSGKIPHAAEQLSPYAITTEPVL